MRPEPPASEVVLLAGDIIGYLAMLGILSVLIIVHECGHFSVARLFGFQTPVFGFGLPFGPSWTVGQRWGTEFRIHALMLGGYVAIPELGDESQASTDAFGVEMKPFRKFPIWQRALVAFAGVGFNIGFAYIIMLSLFLTVGQPIATKTIVSDLPPGNPIAAQAGVKVNDEFVSIDTTPIKSNEDVINYLGQHKDTPVKLNLLREGKPVQVEVTPNSSGKVGMALVSPVTYVKYKDASAFTIAGDAWNRLWKITGDMVNGLGELVKGIASGGKASSPGKPAVGMNDLHGVLAVVYMGKDIVKDWSALAMFTIMISMDLAIINLVPWPALDGGHLAFMTFEAVRGKPMGERAQGEIVKWGFISLLALMAVIMVNDVKALLSGDLDFKKKAKQQQKAPAADPSKTDGKPALENKSDPTAVNTAAPADPDSKKLAAPAGSKPTDPADSSKESSAKPSEPAPAAR